MRVQPQTLAWLDRYRLRWDLLVMRARGDYAHVTAFKREAVDELRDYGFDLRLAFEDDPKNFAMFHAEGRALRLHPLGLLRLTAIVAWASDARPENREPHRALGSLIPLGGSDCVRRSNIEGPWWRWGSGRGRRRRHDRLDVGLPGRRGDEFGRSDPHHRGCTGGAPRVVRPVTRSLRVGRRAGRGCAHRPSVTASAASDERCRQDRDSGLVHGTDHGLSSPRSSASAWSPSAVVGPVSRECATCRRGWAWPAMPGSPSAAR